MKDGGPAFPTSGLKDDGGVLYAPMTGMTLRDYFAAAALQGWASGRNTSFDLSDHNSVASACYKYADAMLAARERKEPQ